MAKKIVVTSGKGGVGKSTLSSSISVCLSEMGAKVLIVDFDIGMGCLDMIFNCESTGIYNWGDIILDRCDIKSAIRTTVGPMLMTAPIAFSKKFTNENIKILFNILDDDYDYIIFDSPAGVGEGFSLAAAYADSGIVVSTPDEICVRAGNIAGEKLNEIGINDVRLIINKFNKKKVSKGRSLNIDESIDSTYLQLLGIVPEDGRLALCSMEGIFALDKAFSKAAIMRISQRISGMDVNLKV
ncbi:MAG: P-loop NTPase [Clostridia bacterium]|nr:P-loop NTPase [Clostridia bacterium]